MASVDALATIALILGAILIIGAVVEETVWVLAVVGAVLIGLTILQAVLQDLSEELFGGLDLDWLRSGWVTVGLIAVAVVLSVSAYVVTNRRPPDDDQSP